MDPYRTHPTRAPPPPLAFASASSSSAATIAAAYPGDIPLRSPRLPPSPRVSSKNFSHPANLRSNGNIDSPPRTPSPKRNRNRNRKGKGKKPERPTTARRITENSDITEEEVDDESRRHSHGLSWQPTTRDSVVDNLLFSLDSLPAGGFGDYETSADADRGRYLRELSTNGFTMSMQSRARGHTQSSSTSELTNSPASMATPKGRRSASTSDFQQSSTPKGKAVGRTNGVAGGDRDVASRQDADHSHLGPLLGPSILGRNGKAISMDTMRSDDSSSASILTRGRPVPSVHSKYESSSDADAAPEPIVAAGPRRMQNPTATGPVYVNPAPPKTPKTPKSNNTSTIRKVTTQSDLRSADISDSHLVPQDIRNQAAEFVRTSSMRGTAGLSPPDVPERMAPSPDPSRRRDQTPPREKTGFFKRVFGGSARTVSSPVERSQSRQVGDANVYSTTYDNSNVQASPRGPPRTSKGDPKQTLPASATQPPPSLSKKSSSFFRRRKKSVNENTPPPPMPVSALSNVGTVSKASHQPSGSISSLRKGMAPFLSEDAQAVQAENAPLTSRPSTALSRAEDSDNPDLFHTGYTPPADATLKLTLNMRSPLSREQTVQSPQDSPTKMKVKKRTADALMTSSPGIGTNHNVSAATSTSTLRGTRSAISPMSDVFHDTVENNADRIVSRNITPIQSVEDLRQFSAGTNVSLSMDDPEWLSVAQRTETSDKKSNRLILRPTASEEWCEANGRDVSTRSISPVLTREGNQSEMLLPVVQVEGTSIPRSVTDPAIISVPSPTIQIPLEMVDEGAEYKERARRIYDGSEEDVPKMDAAAWMGERNTLSSRTLMAYMELFDFAGVNILASLRKVCDKLMLRGETQQFDRIINALSARWCECNPNHGFKTQDVVHTICYSLILLNTDMYLADIGEKMSRSAYVKNTLPTIRRVVLDSATNTFDDATLKPIPQQLRPGIPWSDSNTSSVSANSNTTTTPSSPLPNTPSERSQTPSVDSGMYSINTNLNRLSLRPGPTRNDSDGAMTPDSAVGFGINSLVNNIGPPSLRGWESEVEIVLKAFFASIKAEALPLHNAVLTDLPLNGNRNLSVVDLNNNMKRTGSIISKAPSDNMSYRSKNDLRSMTMRWGQSRTNRSTRPKVYAASTIGSSRTSFDDGTSGFWSPSAQSSKFSFSKTLTSPSVSSFSNLDPFKHSIGFANALSEAIIREEGDNPSDSFTVPGGLLEDESLALEGAPWAKEGLVKHKHHLESGDRKAKERSWNDCFAVISKGKLTLFAFGSTSSSSTTAKSSLRKPFNKPGKAASVSGSTTVGGGDWIENAEQLDVFILRQTIASTLPPPGYSKLRPHVWALSLPSGAVHLFQVGTPDIAKEFMETANYWSARLSKEPLAGGVSNVEYGWSDRVINTALLPDSSRLSESGGGGGAAPPSLPPLSLHNNTPSSTPRIGHPPPTSSSGQGTHGHNPSLSTDRSTTAGRSSLQSSIRGSFDTARGVATGGMAGSSKTRLPGDKIQLHEWIPPSQSLMASQLMEVDQLRGLREYVKSVEEELRVHSERKGGIELAYSPRHPNMTKSMNNWQRKSDYLLREIVKFQTYVDALVAAQKAKEEVARKRKVEGGGVVQKGGDILEKEKENEEGSMAGLGLRGEEVASG